VNVGVWTHCVGSGYDVVVGCNEHCNEPSCSMKGGESEFFKQDCAALTYFTSNSNSDIGACYKMHMCHVLCMCGWGWHPLV
jgi:hypothetical protein